MSFTPNDHTNTTSDPKLGPVVSSDTSDNEEKTTNTTSDPKIDPSVTQNLGKDHVITPDPERDQMITPYHPYDSEFGEIIYQEDCNNAALMFHYEDSEGNPIGESFSLSMKNPLKTYKDLLQTTFVPNLKYCSDHKRFKVPSNVHSVVVMGLSRKYNNENSAMHAFGISDLDPIKYVPTIGACSHYYSYSYSFDTRFSCNQFNFKTGERTLSHGNDFVKNIVFVDGKFDHLELTKPIVEIA